MIRYLLVVALPLLAGLAMAGESDKSPTRPVGIWKRGVEGGSWAIAIENSRLVFTAIGPGERVTTLTAPKYEISDEGVLFGYVREVVSTSGEDESRVKGVYPFAFRLKVNGETLTVSDLSVRGLDARAHFVMTGDYKRETTAAASKPQPDVKR